MSGQIDTYQLKRKDAELCGELDILYMMHLAAKAEKLDHDRYSSALRHVWKHINRIEEEMAALLDGDEPESGQG